jgi:hypothetical protein
MPGSLHAAETTTHCNRDTGPGGGDAATLPAHHGIPFARDCGMTNHREDQRAPTSDSRQQRVRSQAIAIAVALALSAGALIVVWAGIGTWMALSFK